MPISFAGLCLSQAEGAGFSHDPILVGTSLAVAALGSFAALGMAERSRHTLLLGRWLWLLGCAMTLGGTVWTTHFIGILAISNHWLLGLDVPTTILSLVLAVATVALGLGLHGPHGSGGPRMISAGLLIGVGVASMHYMGMSALHFASPLVYRPGLWGLSIIIAVAAAIAALVVAASRISALQRAGAAVVMAAAIGGMHYTGMEAAVIVSGAPGATAPGLQTDLLAFAVIGISFALLAAVAVVITADRRLERVALREAEVRQQSQRELIRMQSEIMRRLCTAGECRDDETGRHVMRIGILAERLARQSGLNDATARDIGLAAPLHDIGKIGIDDAILRKPGPLTAEETLAMRRHPQIGERILRGSNVPVVDMAADIAATHHESWDGSGYPCGLSGSSIPIAGRIVAIVDVFDALMSQRPYKPAWPLDRVTHYLRGEAGRRFDPHLIDVFLGDLPAILAMWHEHHDDPQPCSAPVAVSPFKLRPDEREQQTADRCPLAAG